MTNEEIREQLKQAIEGERVMLFMKGTPEAPGCGFSARVVSILDTLGTEYSALDILPDPRIRQELSQLSAWPTIPQLFLSGELVGGCDIVSEMYESGELAEALGAEQQAGGANGEPGTAAPAGTPTQSPPLQIG